MKARTLAAALLLAPPSLAAAPPEGGTAPSGPTAPVDVDAAIALAQAQDEAVRALLAEARAAGIARSGVARVGDPEIRISSLDRLDGDPATRDLDVALRASLPAPGALRAATVVPQAEEDALLADAAALQWETACDVRAAFELLALATRRAQLLTEALAAQEERLTALAAQAEGGAAGRLDVLTAQVDRDEAKADLAQLEAEAAALRARLAARMGLTAPPSLLLPDLDALAAAPLPSADALVATAIGEAPALKSAQARLRAAEVSAATLALGWAPHLRFVQVGYEIEPPTLVPPAVPVSPWSFQLAVGLPLPGQVAADHGEARWEAEAARRELASLRQLAEIEIRALHAEVTARLQAVGPAGGGAEAAAAQAAQETRRLVEAGALDRVALADARLRQVGVADDRLDRLADALAALDALRRAVGAPLPQPVRASAQEAPP